MLNLDKVNMEEKESSLTEKIAQDVQSELVNNAAQDDSKPDEVIDTTTQKYLYIQPVAQEFKEKLKKVVDDLVAVRLDVFNKKVELFAKQEVIKEKIKFLDESKKVRVDKNEFERMEKSAQSYVQLLDGIINELSGEIAYYNVFISDEKPPVDKVVVPLKAPDKIEDYLELQMNGIKRYVKTVKRDISISYSRYSFGFEEQLKHLTFVESYIQTKEAQARAKEMAKKD